jgi:cell division protein FtsI/penicillin-binding protein 2
MYSGNNIFGYSNRKKEIQKRTWSLLFVFILFFSLLTWKISNHMYFKAEPLKAMFNAQYTINETYGLAYNLLDCNGKELLDYTYSYYAAVDPGDYLRFNEYTNKYDLEALNITLRNYNNNYDLERIKYNGSTEKIKYKIDENTYEKLKNIEDVKGFYVYSTRDVIKDRPWKVENLLINTKYYNADGKLVLKNEDSIEMQVYDKTKKNKYEKIRFDKYVNGEISKGEIIEPENNTNVRLTLDKEIQDKVEEILHEKKYEKYEQIGVVLMESSNGKIRAMAQKDDNSYNANLGIPDTNGFYCGSIFKIIVDEAGLNENLIDKYKKYTVKGTLFQDSHEKLNQYSVAEALAYSSNDIFAQLGSKVGFENMKSYAEKQGLLGRVLNFQQEQSGKFEGDDTLVGDISLTAIGQNVRMTPLEAISIPNTIINKGIYVQPNIIDAYVNDENVILEEITSNTSPVLERDTAEIVKQHMVDVVNKGTGNQAYIEGMNVGGKTGTSEYFVKDKDGKNVEHSDGWFVGFFNVGGKNYSMVVFVKNISINQENKADEEGGTTAAPIFKQVANAIKEMN